MGASTHGRGKMRALARPQGGYSVILTATHYFFQVFRLLAVEIVNAIAPDPRSGKLSQVRNPVGPPRQVREHEGSEKEVTAVLR
jgi:hypothetical protein